MVGRRFADAVLGGQEQVLRPEGPDHDLQSRRMGVSRQAGGVERPARVVTRHDHQILHSDRGGMAGDLGQTL
ncbi:hypothetical protein D3C73_1475810 [compost metagenome]